mmetsp:Transcript_47700/g.118153  ORF Transcript_47700/g.118153 Transcript_47700/m.118153 type:complete len:87 (+) Transcript_47700:228-488(+)
MAWEESHKHVDQGNRIGFVVAMLMHPIMRVICVMTPTKHETGCWRAASFPHHYIVEPWLLVLKVLFNHAKWIGWHTAECFATPKCQ